MGGSGKRSRVLEAAFERLAEVTALICEEAEGGLPGVAGGLEVAELAVEIAVGTQGLRGALRALRADGGLCGDRREDPGLSRALEGYRRLHQRRGDHVPEDRRRVVGEGPPGDDETVEGGGVITFLEPQLAEAVEGEGEDNCVGGRERGRGGLALFAGGVIRRRGLGR